MKISTKRKLTFVTIAFFNFFCGVEYAVVFPSLWGYISERFHGDSYMMGMIIAAFSFSGLFSNPLVGKWADKFPNTKLILLLTNVGEIFGSFMYFVGISTWFLVASRLVCGIGVGGGAAMLADITKSSSEESRTGLLSFVMATRQIGLLIGPAFNFLFLHLNYKLGPFTLDKYSAPGLFMTIIWILLEIQIFFMYFNLTALKTAETLQEQLSFDYANLTDGGATASLQSTLTASHGSDSRGFNNSSGVSTAAPSGGEDISTDFKRLKTPALDSATGQPPNLMIESAEQFIIGACETKNTHQGKNVAAQRDFISDQDEGFNENGINNDYRSSSQELLFVREEKKKAFSESIKSFAKDYLRDEIVVLLGLVFASVNAQTSLEAITTPLTKEIFNYEELENSIIYLLAGLQTLLVFIAIHFLSKKMSDRILLLIGQILLIAALVWFLIFIPNAKPNDKSVMPYYVIGCLIDLTAIPILIVCSASLISKITSTQNQALTHGLRRSVMSIACIIGPLWGGAFLAFRHILFAVPLGISILFLVLFIISYKDFLPPKRGASLPTEANLTINSKTVINENLA